MFIHDPRATGPAEATLRPPPNLEKISNTGSKSGSSKLLCADGGDRDNPLSFPDIPRDPDSIEVTTAVRISELVQSVDDVDSVSRTIVSRD